MKTHTPNFMTNSLKNSLLPLLALAIWGLSSCTGRDDLFGNDLVPPSQQMGSSIDSTVSVYTYISKLDSIETSILDYYQPFMGSYIDPVVGRIDAQVFTNYSPYGFEHEIEFNYFGENPVIDSLRYAFTFTGAVGDTTQEVTIDVYEVKDYAFKRDSAYFSNFDMSPYIGSEPLVSFTQKGPGTTTGRMPQELAERLLDNTHSKDNIYYVDTAFHQKFPGLYLKFRQPATSGEGKLLQLDLSQSVMFLCYHNTGPNKPDTLEQRLLFYGEYTTYDYISFSTIQHDYTYADPGQGGIQVSEIGQTTIPTQYMYVQGLAGLMGTLRIDEEHIARLQQRVLDLGYSHIALHRAELQTTLVDADAEQYDKSFPALGIYFDILDYEFLPEYNPILAGMGGGYTPTLGGKLNRSRGTYAFDITSYVQRLITGKETRYTTQLLPSYDLRNHSFRSWIYGTASPYPPRLVLTYTMIK